MSALDGFYSTWNKARATFGVGTPVDGSQHDGSSQLLRMKGMVESAAQHDGWQGKGAEAYAAANKQHAAVYQKLADLDKKMAAEVTNAANIVTNGRTQLDTTKSWVDSAVKSLPASLSSQAREQSLIPIANKGITEVNNTVKNANGDMLRIGFRITDIKNEYDDLSKNQKFGPEGDGTSPREVAADHGSEVPAPPQAGDPVDPADPWTDDPRFGHWAEVPPAPPYVGSSPPPLKSEYRPYADDSPLKVGPTTGMYTPGKSWIGNIDAPAIQGKEGYRFRLAGQEATTTTRMVFQDGQWHQQRWVQNVYEYQRNTSYSASGDIGLKGTNGKTGGLDALPPIQNIDREWKPISLSEIAVKSAMNPTVTYYLPDGCGGTVKFDGGVAPNSAVPNPVPIMTRPR